VVVVQGSLRMQQLCTCAAVQLASVAATSDACCLCCEMQQMLVGVCAACAAAAARYQRIAFQI
jgi:hypothetical protein